MTTVTTPAGAVIRDDDGVRLEFVRTYPDPIERVWRAITDSDELATWYGTWRGDPATGTVELASIEGGGEYKPVEILECTAPRRLAFVLPTPYGPWPISITLSESDGTTTGVFVHRLTEPYDSTNIGPGWHYYLDRLGALLSGAKLPEFEDWPSYEPLGARYPLPD
jgi:uncharacterized protein YndB with AHSA1/START domain